MIHSLITLLGASTQPLASRKYLISQWRGCIRCVWPSKHPGEVRQDGSLSVWWWWCILFYLFFCFFWWQAGCSAFSQELQAGLLGFPGSDLPGVYRGQSERCPVGVASLGDSCLLNAGLVRYDGEATVTGNNCS